MISRPRPFSTDLYTEPVGIIPRQEHTIINKNNNTFNGPRSNIKHIIFSLIVPIKIKYQKPLK